MLKKIRELIKIFYFEKLKLKNVRKYVRIQKNNLISNHWVWQFRRPYEIGIRGGYCFFIGNFLVIGVIL